jgi:hypothetical protein
VFIVSATQTKITAVVTHRQSAALNRTSLPVAQTATVAPR